MTGQPQRTRDHSVQFAFIAKVAGAAQKTQAEHGIPASVTIAQCILESGWGKCAPGNNYFGIKAGQAHVPYVEFATHEQDARGVAHEENDKFRSFASIDDCFKAHGDLIAFGKDHNGKLIYADAMAAVDDPLTFALRLKECGYSTDHDYVQKIESLINEYGLTKYDESSEQSSATAGGAQA